MTRPQLMEDIGETNGFDHFQVAAGEVNPDEELRQRVLSLVNEAFDRGTELRFDQVVYPVWPEEDIYGFEIVLRYQMKEHFDWGSAELSPN